jgi:hypothetical protein
LDLLGTRHQSGELPTLCKKQNRKGETTPDSPQLLFFDDIYSWHFNCEQEFRSQSVATRP